MATHLERSSLLSQKMMTMRQDNLPGQFARTICTDSCLDNCLDNLHGQFTRPIYKDHFTDNLHGQFARIICPDNLQGQFNRQFARTTRPDSFCPAVIAQFSLHLNDVCYIAAACGHVPTTWHKSYSYHTCIKILSVVIYWSWKVSIQPLMVP